MVNQAEKELGAFVGRYETDIAGRGRAALVAVLIGLVALIIAIPMVIDVFSGTPEAATVAGLAAGVALMTLWWGLVCGWRFFMRQDEVFRIREGGLAYEHHGYFRLLPWDDIRRVTDRGQNNWLGQTVGWDVYCIIKPKSGRRLIITGHTPAAQHLADTICQAVQHGIHPTRPPHS